ncbi:TPA: hypothetical protein ACJCWE_000434 [Yersinia enterocolitica]
MSNAHCICPEFISNNIGKHGVFESVFIGNLLNSSDQIVLDREGRIILEYFNSVKDNTSAFMFMQAWKAMLDSSDNGKVLLTSVAERPNIRDVVYNAISQASTTFNKSIITHDNNNYSKYINELNRQRINLLNLQNVSRPSIELSTHKKVNYDELDLDISWILQRLVRRYTNSKIKDEHNDYLRDMLLSKKYEVKDQTREGLSSTGRGAGELDLVIEDRGDIFSIIEPMRLKCIDTKYINIHYKKLIHNYNPLMVKRTFLITYYEGKKFGEWWRKYSDHIGNLVASELIPDSEITFTKVEQIETKYANVKKLCHHCIDNSSGEYFSTIHYAVKF